MKIKKLIYIILCIIIVVSNFAGCGDSVKSKKSVDKGVDSEIIKKLEKAYVYTLPLMIMDATNTKMTNTIKATSVQAPENQFIHAGNLATPESKNVVTPNVDTVYSQLFLNLTEDAVVIELPRTERFCMIEVLDAYTNCITLLDAQTFETSVEKYIFTGKNFTGIIPEDMKEIKCPTNLAWVIIRTISYGTDDLENIKSIQGKMDSYTLSQFNTGKTDVKPVGNFNKDNNFIPVEYIMTMSMDKYFTAANKLMEENPPLKEDKDFLKELSDINVGAGLKFDSTVFGENADKIWETLISDVVNICTDESKKFMVQNGVWNYFGKPIGEFGLEYYYRALIALAGLGANPVSVAVYPKASVDSDGNRLKGENNYILHFDKDTIPKIKKGGFWSVTIYNSSDNLLISNDINRYCINDRSDVTYNEDGSFDIYIQNQNPGEDKQSNWLPSSKEEFHLYLRIYLPEDEVVQNKQKLPVIKKDNK